MEPTWSTSSQYYPYRTLFKSPTFLDRAHAKGTLCGLVCKNSEFLVDGEPPTEDTYVVLIVMDQDGDLMYEDGEEGKHRYGKLLQDCLHEHHYDFNKGIVTFRDPRLSKITLNVWQYEIAMEYCVDNEVRLAKGDEGTAVDNLGQVFQETEGGFQTNILFYNDKRPFTFHRSDPDALTRKTCIIQLPESKLPYWTEDIHIWKGDGTLFESTPCDPGDYSIFRRYI